MFAIIKSGGKQYKVAIGDKLKLERLNFNEGETVEFAEVLMKADEENGIFQIGRPFIEGAKVVGKVLSEEKDKKVTIIKFKPKKRYKRKMGHRQIKTEVEITDIK
ncbi:MAG: 50S ribosomal protein L21 [bacterium]